MISIHLLYPFSYGTIQCPIFVSTSIIRPKPHFVRLATKKPVLIGLARLKNQLLVSVTSPDQLKQVNYRLPDDILFVPQKIVIVKRIL